MIHELDQADFVKVKALFQPLAEILPFCAAVLEGTQPGRIFVDDPADPETAFMNTRKMWGYLAGDPTNEVFNQALNAAISAREVVDEEAYGLLLHCHPEDWGGNLATLLAPRQPITARRRRYTCNQPTYDWRTHLPQGFTIELVDETLLTRPDLEVPEDVKNMIEAWETTPDPAHRGFGFVAFHEGKIVAHAVVDCIVGDVGDIGLVTDEAYRRRGLATVTSAAAVEYGLTHGLSTINWDCNETNPGSLRTAEKLGFERQGDHTMYFIDFDETWHQILVAQGELEAGRYQETIDVCQGIFAQGGGAPPYTHFLSACAWSGLQERDKAFEALNTAVDLGWGALSLTESHPSLEHLHGTAEWEAVLVRMRQNRQEQSAG